MRGVNDDSVAEVLRWCLERGTSRFIEQMPLDAQHAWDRSALVTAAEVRDRLQRRFTLTPLPGRGQRSGPTLSRRRRPRQVGIIASVTEPF